MSTPNPYGDGRIPPGHPHRVEIGVSQVFREQLGPRRRWLWIARRWGGIEAWAARRATFAFYRAWKNRTPKL